MSNAKHWCFTLNNYNEADREAILSWDKVTYVIIGKEVGESGTPHLQGYICFEKKKRLTGLKKLLPTAHWEVRKGTVQQAADYCKKDSDFEERGTLPISRAGSTQQERYQHAWDCAKADNLDEIDPDIRIRHYRTLQQIAADHMIPSQRLPTTTGMWIYGPSGSGKSTLARQIGDEAGGYYLKLANKWWDGYCGEDVVILEDLDPKHECLAHHLKLWCDCHDFIAEKKGTAIRIRPKKIIITSQYSIEEIFNDVRTQQALNRRCEIQFVDAR